MGEQESGLEAANLAAKAQRDSIGTTAEGHTYGGRYNTTIWAQSGRVLYVHGGGIDQPLGMVRMDYSYNFPDPVLIVPHANWRSAYETSTFSDGDTRRCMYVWVRSSDVGSNGGSTGGNTLPGDATGTSTADVAVERCVERDFPGAYMGMTRLLKRQTVAGPTTWMGSVVMDGQDASGLSYRRNRYYDTNTGRFTQGDPSGLAGGLNVYRRPTNTTVPWPSLAGRPGLGGGLGI